MMALEKRYLIIALYRAKVLLTLEGSRTYLRYLWLVIDPVLELGIYYTVFTYVFQYGGSGYGAQLVTGILVIRLFTQCTHSAPYLLSHNESVLLSVVLPKYVFPLAEIVSGLFKFLFLLAVLCVCLVGMGVPVRPSWLMLAPYTLLYAAFTLGVSMLLAGIGPFFPDLGQLYPKLVMVLYWGSGVFYNPKDFIAPEYLPLFYANPLAGFIDGYRNCLLSGNIDFSRLIYLGSVSLFILLSGYALLSRFDKYYPRVVAQR